MLWVMTYERVGPIDYCSECPAETINLSCCYVNITIWKTQRFLLVWQVEYIEKKVQPAVQ